MTYLKRKVFGSEELREDCIVRLNDDGSKNFIPNDLKNRDWQLYLEWLALGNQPLPEGEE